MRKFLAAALLASTLPLGMSVAAQAQDAPWCAFYDEYTHNCGFYTFQQCLDTIRGVGGICRRNPRARSGDDRPGGQQREREPDFQFRPFR